MDSLTKDGYISKAQPDASSQGNSKLSPSQVALWIINEIFGFLNSNPLFTLVKNPQQHSNKPQPLQQEGDLDIGAEAQILFPVDPLQFSQILKMISDNYILPNTAKRVINQMVKGDTPSVSPMDIVKKNEWMMVKDLDDNQLRDTCKQVLDSSPKEVLLTPKHNL